MLVTITTHDLHHEAKRLLEMGREGYASRFEKITRIEKWAAVFMFANYRVHGVGYPGDLFWPGVMAAIGRRLISLGVTEIAVKASRSHDCGLDKAYRIDEWVGR